jgi:hypothetical protein
MLNANKSQNIWLRGRDGCRSGRRPSWRCLWCRNRKSSLTAFRLCTVVSHVTLGLGGKIKLCQSPKGSYLEKQSFLRGWLHERFSAWDLVYLRFGVRQESLPIFFFAPNRRCNLMYLRFGVRVRSANRNTISHATCKR